MEERTESQVSESLFGPPRFLFIYFFSQMPKILNHRTIFEHFQSKTPAGDTFPVHIDFIIIMIFLFYVQWAKRESSKAFFFKPKMHFPPEIFI